MKHFGHQRAFGFEVMLGKVQRQFNQMLNMRSVAEAMPDKLGAMSDSTTSAN